MEEANTVALEDLTAMAILTFCENLAELGCPKDKDADIWFREMCYDDYPTAHKTMGKLLDIMHRDAEEFRK